MAKKRTDQVLDEVEAIEAIKFMGAAIRTDRELIAVLQDAAPELREQVYGLIKPYLGYMPRPFALITFAPDANA